jgi:hypothetical protein
MWKRRMDVFERKGFFDDAIMELELPMQLKIFEQAMGRKKDEVHRLATEIKSIDNELAAMKVVRSEEAAEKARQTTKKRRLDNYNKEAKKKRVIMLDGETLDHDADDESKDNVPPVTKLSMPYVVR